MEPSNDSNTRVPDDLEECTKQGISENYWIYLVVYVVVLISVYVPVMLPQISLLVYRVFRKAHQEAIKIEKGVLAPVQATSSHSKLKLVKEWAKGEHPVGNSIIVGSLAVNIAYFVLYWGRTDLLSEICLDQYSPEWKTEVVFSVYFFLYFCFRMFGGYNRRDFWFDEKTFIDLVTIPHIFVSIALDRDWLGLRFLRIVWFNHVIDLLKQLPIFKSQRWIDILTLLFRFLTFWFACAAAIHLLEVTGDPWHDFETRHSDLRFFDYIYFLIVTISTVGYGDVSPQTDTGRAFVSVMIIGAIILVAYATPTISELFESYSLYSGSYTEVTDANHVVVSGHITAESVKYFLSDFLHPDRKDDYTKVLLLNPKEPDHELKAIIRKYFRRVKYFKGSVLNSKDLKRVKVKTASAFVILSPNYSLNPESEDESNLMRVVSIKNMCNNAKVIVQMLQPHSLQQIVRIPSWNPNEDTAICKSELKLGLMAQNCLCPGISTLLSNLVHTTSELTAGTDGWEMKYSEGAGNEVYKHKLPEAFYGKSYEEVAHLCFMNHRIMLIAIDATPEKKECTAKTEQLIHPAPFGLKINKGMSGYFIAQNKEEIEVLESDSLVIDGYQHKADSLGTHQESQEAVSIPLSEDILIDDQGNSVEMHHMEQTGSTSDIYYYKCKERNFEKALKEKVKDEEVNHIILCTFTPQDSDELNSQSFVHPLQACTMKTHKLKSMKLNLHGFVSPLRARTLKKSELKPIFIIGNKQCIQNEWSNIAEYDDVFVIDGSPLDQDVLKAANIAHCSSCIILGSTANLDEDPALIDKQPILCSLTLTSLDFKGEAVRGEALTGKHIYKVTELYKEENVQFLDLEDEDDNAEGFIHSQPFAQGECVSSTIFDSLVAGAYFNPGTTALFEKLVTGGSMNQAKCEQKKTPLPTLELLNLYRPRFLQISLMESPGYQRFQRNCEFSDLFKALLEEKQLCIGIYRCIGNRHQEDESSKRYVITSPPHNMKIEPTDNIFVMVTDTNNQLA